MRRASEEEVRGEAGRREGGGEARGRVGELIESRIYGERG